MGLDTHEARSESGVSQKAVTPKGGLEDRRTQRRRVPEIQQQAAAGGLLARYVYVEASASNRKSPKNTMPLLRRFESKPSFFKRCLNSTLVSGLRLAWRVKRS